MFIPVNDQNPLKNIKRPYATWGLILANIVIFAVQSGLGAEVANIMIMAGGLTPTVLFGEPAEAGFDVLPGFTTLITYQFLHGSFFHLIGNMVFLYIFGDNIEDATGPARFVLFYVLCGVTAGFVHSAVDPLSPIPLIGASGATSGLVGAYLVLHPRVRFWVLALGKVPLRLKAYWIIGFWFLWQIGSITYEWIMQEEPVVAWFAHLGGFFAGAMLIIVMRQANIALWDKDLEISKSPGRTPRATGGT